MPLERFDIFSRCDCGVGPRLDRVVFCGKPERVPAHGVQNPFAAHAIETANDVGGRVALRVSDVQPCTGGVGKHVQHIQLFLRFRVCRFQIDAKRLMLVPVGLPFGFDAFDFVVVTGHGLRSVSVMFYLKEFS